MDKTCVRCGKTKPIAEFSKRGDSYRGYCRDCDRATSREHYQRNKKYYREKNVRNRQRLAAQMWEYKSTHPCEICGETHPACLVFHHLEAESKENSVSRLVGSGMGWKRILAEVQKCQVLCANCHRKLHHGETG